MHELSCHIAVQAWNRKELALFWNTQTSSLIVRVLTQELMSTLLMHYKTYAAALFKSCLLNMTSNVASVVVACVSSCRSDADKGTYGFKPFGEFDKAGVLHVRKDAMPYRRVLLYHAAVAVAFQRSRGMLRDDIAFHADDYDVVLRFMLTTMMWCLILKKSLMLKGGSQRCY